MLRRCRENLRVKTNGFFVGNNGNILQYRDAVIQSAALSYERTSVFCSTAAQTRYYIPYYNMDGSAESCSGEEAVFRRRRARELTGVKLALIGRICCFLRPWRDGEGMHCGNCWSLLPGAWDYKSVSMCVCVCDWTTTRSVPFKMTPNIWEGSIGRNQHLKSNLCW